MSPLLIAGVLDGARAVLDRMFPDPAERARAELELLKAQAEGTFEQKAAQALALAQIGVNNTEAGSAGIFKGGWRPAAGWVCVSALAWQFVARPMVAFGFAVAGHPVPELPTIDGALWELLFGLLGLGTLRSVERIKGKS